MSYGWDKLPNEMVRSSTVADILCGVDEQESQSKPEYCSLPPQRVSAAMRVLPFCSEACPAQITSLLQR